MLYQDEYSTSLGWKCHLPRQYPETVRLEQLERVYNTRIRCVGATMAVGLFFEGRPRYWQRRPNQLKAGQFGRWLHSYFLPTSLLVWSSLREAVKQASTRCLNFSAVCRDIRWLSRRSLLDSASVGNSIDGYTCVLFLNTEKMKDLRRLHRLSN